jgi:hypothetical protein
MNNILNFTKSFYAIVRMIITMVILTSCDKKEDDIQATITPPTVSITSATYLGPFEATLNVEIKVGTQSLISQGFIYSTSPIDSPSDGTKILTTNLSDGKITAKVNGLLKDTKYYVKSFAATSDTTVLSNELIFTTINTNEWTKLLSFSAPISDSYSKPNTGFEINDQAYMFTGLGGSKNIVDFLPFHIYDPVQYSYTVSIDITVPFRKYYSSFAINDTIYVGLGRNFDLSYRPLFRNDIWKYDVSSQNWVRGRDFPIETEESNSFSVNNFGYIIGKAEKTGQKVFYQYSPLSGVWLPRTLPNKPFFYFIHTAYSDDNFGYIIISNSSGDVFGDVDHWKYDPLSDQWTELSKLPISASFNTLNNLTFCISMSKKSYLIAGVSSGQTLVEYDIEKDSWIDRGKLPSQVLGGFALNGRIYVCSSESLYMYTPE